MKLQHLHPVKTIIEEELHLEFCCSLTDLDSDYLTHEHDDPQLPTSATKVGCVTGHICD